MTQKDFGNIDPNSTSGTELAGKLDDFRDAVESLNMGASRPPYAQAGMLWASNADPTNIVINFFDGATDRPVVNINIATGAVTIPNAPNSGLPSAAMVNGNPKIQGDWNYNSGQGSIGVSPSDGSIRNGQTMTISLIGDSNPMPANKVFQTNANGGTYWGDPVFPPVYTGSRRILEFTGPGVYTWTAPAGVYGVFVILIGGGGGNQDTTDGAGNPTTTFGGPGGRSRGWVQINPGATLTIQVGGQGGHNGTNTGGYGSSGGTAGSTYASSSLGTILVGGGGLSYATGSINVAGSTDAVFGVPVIQGPSKYEWGLPETGGYASLEWIQ